MRVIGGNRNRNAAATQPQRSREIWLFPQLLRAGLGEVRFLFCSTTRFAAI